MCLLIFLNLILIKLKDLYLTILLLTSISLNTIALMMVSNIINEFINPLILLTLGFVLFLYVAFKYLKK